MELDGQMLATKRVLAWFVFVLTCMLLAAPIATAALANVNVGLGSVGDDTSGHPAGGYDGVAPLSFAYDGSLGLSTNDRNTPDATGPLFARFGESVAADTAVGPGTGLGPGAMWRGENLAGDGGQMLYRGVPAGTTRYQQALNGVVVPRGTALDQASLVKHVLGEDVAAGVTSWTADPAVAARFAGSNGKVLQVPMSQVSNQVVPRPFVGGKYGSEAEVLLKGIINVNP